MASIIERVLQIKGENKFLKIGSFTAVEAAGNYKGYDWIAIFNCKGCRSGYIGLPETYPSTDIMELESFLSQKNIWFFGNELDIKRNLNIKDNKMWIGFYANLYKGCSDYSLAAEVFGTCALPLNVNSKIGKLITLEDIKNECTKIIDELIKHKTLLEESDDAMKIQFSDKLLAIEAAEDIVQTVKVLKELLINNETGLMIEQRTALCINAIYRFINDDLIREIEDIIKRNI